MTAGLLLGRFQPFHNGHAFVLKQIFRECDEAIIVIGSAQASHDLQNPFSAGERFEMIRKALGKEAMLKTAIIPIEDINRYPLWVAHVESRCPKFDRVYSRNPLTASLFRQGGYDVVDHELYERQHCSGTEIRRMMAEGEPWEKYVPKVVAAYIRKIEGVERVKSLA